MSAATSTLLRLEDREYLDEHFAWEATTEGGMVCVTIKEFPLVAGLAPAANEILIRIPSGFPDVGPDMFWFAEPVTRGDGAVIPATDLLENYLGRLWQRWSRHIGNQWRPGTDDLRSYVTYIRTCLRTAAR
jgi:hypothetical protein